MKELINLKSIDDLHALFNLGPSHHPLVAVLDFGKVREEVDENTRIVTDFYSVMFKNYCKNHLKYGRKSIDFQDGNLICIAPNQMIEIDSEIEIKENSMGWGLFFHPDLIRATSLHDKIKDFGFFSYEVSEALHLSEKEKLILFDCVKKIESELQENIDTHSQYIIVSTIELLLNYCSRFYGRQLITRSQSNKSVVSQVEDILTQYLAKTKIEDQGLPTVNYLAERVHLSPSYLSDLLKKETGKNAQEHIHFHLIEEAKKYLVMTDKNINEIAFFLGFDYPQYFNKLFKQKTGKTPLEYRNRN